MGLRDNPFYILKVSCDADRRMIVSASEEMSFFQESEICSRAQNELINLNKRLSAEMNWFIDTDQDSINAIISNIDNSEQISTDGLSSISLLNATIYNFTLSDFSDPYELGFSILEIDDIYSEVNIDALTSTINYHREKAKLGLVQKEDVQAELRKKRELIRQIIAEKVSNLDQDIYIELVTMLAEKCVVDEDYKDGVILSDVIDQYEIMMQSELENATDRLKKSIERIKQLSDTTGISESVNVIIKRVEKWDTLAQPLQLRSKSSGMPHKISEDLGLALRDLAVYLHNEKGLTKDALQLVNAMKGIFAELDELSETFKSDSGTLTGIINDQKNTEEIVYLIKSLENESERVKITPALTSDFIERVKTIDQIIKDSSLEHESKIKTREAVCYIARNTAIALHNTKHQTKIALTIIEALIVLFHDSNILYTKLEEDAITLRKQLNLNPVYKPNVRTEEDIARYKANNNKTTSSRKGCIIPALILFGIVLFVIIIASLSNSTGTSSGSTKSNTSSNSSYYTSPYYTITLNKTSGSGGTSSISARNGYSMPSATAPTRSGYTFKGYYSSTNGTGTQYYDSNMRSVHNWDKTSGGTLYAYWIKKAEERFSSSSSSGDPVYVDIVSIFPKFGIYTQGSTNYTHFVCQCKTSTNSTVWIYMTCSEYKSNFDSSASTNVNRQYADEVTLKSSKRIHGTATKAESILSGLSYNTAAIVVDFSYVG